MKSLLVGLALLVGCTRPNPEVCCGDAADCNAAGIPEGRTCAADLVCINHSCEEPLPPECTESAQCTTAPLTVCDPATLMCRGCIFDTECDSGACGEDGVCIAEESILYVSATGVSIDTCARAKPCTIEYALSQSTTARFTYVFSPGTYMLAMGVQFLDTMLPARRADLHGHRAVITKGTAPPVGQPVIFTTALMTIRDLQVVAQPDAPAIRANNDITLERVTLSGGFGLIFGGNLIVRDVVVSAKTQGLAIIDASQTVNITNLLVYGSTDVAVNLGTAGGTVSHATIADSGASTTVGAQGIRCSAGVTLRASIVWTPGGTQPSVSGCALDNVIAGPLPVFGARATDPGFVNPAGRDFHLSAGSVARDAAEDGPPTDFEGDPRPQGAKFDIGADEAIP